jgi:hypothetical protein
MRRDIYSDQSPLLSQEKKMNKQEILATMHSAFEEANRSLCVQNGMDPAEIDENISKSELAVTFLLTEVFNKLAEKNIIATS